MSSFPLIRTNSSNEKIMKWVFVNTLLFLLPHWIEKPVAIFSFLTVLTIGLLIDSIWNLIRYGKPVCGVSAGVTAGIMECLTPGVPLWGKISGIIISLVIGKHIWGGAGKNPVNPAVLAVFCLSFFFFIPLQIFPANLLTIPALSLSLIHLRIRPLQGLGLLIGMSISLFFQHNLNFEAFISYGVIFWSCLVVTDPVTITPKPLWGFIGTLIVGIIGLSYIPLSRNPLFILTLSILFFNLISSVFDMRINRVKYYRPKPFRINKLVLSIDGSYKRKGPGENDYVVPEQISPSQIVELIKRVQLCGFGGGGFPVAQKIETVKCADTNQKYFIINGVECDPGLVHDHWLIREYPNEICMGIALIKKCIDFEKVVLAVKDDSVLNLPPHLDIQKVPERYPIGAERILIKTVLNREIPFGEIPAKSGILVLNVQTVYTIFKAVCNPEIPLKRFITVTNLKTKQTKVAEVEFGQMIVGIAKSTFSDSRGLVFTGGGIMNARRAEDEETVTYNTNFIAIGDKPVYKESAQCSKCNRCVDVCPAHLKVNRIAELVRKEKLENVDVYHPEYCLSCGACSYVCLAGKNLSEQIKVAKEWIMREKTI